MRVSEIVKMIKKAGCWKVREGESHEIWYSPITGKKFSVSRHKTEELPPGTENSIKKDAGLK